MRIATWNVNSIRARLERVTAWLQAQSPDVLCLQETKVVDADFPGEALRDLGYELAVHGQKTYNGVAILSRIPLTEVTCGFADGEEEAGARLVGATVGGVRIYSAYVPNGQVVGSDNYALKLRWLERLGALLAQRNEFALPTVVCGDFNVAPEERDVHDPDFWRTQVLFHPTARAALQQLCAPGLVDVFRLHHTAAGLYSWWDYRQLAFPKNLGLRIDLIVASHSLAAHCSAATIDRQARGGSGASDHAPVLAQFDL
jgi:exodeoxyribonuclease III